MGKNWKIKYDLEINENQLIMSSSDFLRNKLLQVIGKVETEKQIVREKMSRTISGVDFVFFSDAA